MQDRYNSKEVEQKLAKFWEEKGIYKFDVKSKKEVYAIDTPPPTISGYIGIHHIFSYSQADFIARYKRMQGFNVFYPMGYDNNGLPTELLTEKNNNTTAEREGREKFIMLVEQETKKYEEIFGVVWRSIGLSVDWSLLYTTISKESQRLSQLSFIELNKINRVYRKETPTIWCTKEKTALSQMELKDQMLKSKFVDIRFADDVIIATTRPEMLPACVAIFVNPEDVKNRKLVGRKVKVPIFGQEVEILADARVNPEKGTGIVMCCTFGDVTDIEWYKAYNLKLKIVIDERGKMLPEYFGGLKIKEARKKIIDDLKEKGYLISERDIEHSVNVHERCGTEIEFLVKKQWYIKYLDLRGKFIELGNELNWHPSYMHVRYDNWINGLQWDWLISRQRYYGIPFPVWYCKKCGETVFADEKDLPVNPLKSTMNYKCAKCGSSDLQPEEDVLDTWATSSLTPLLNARWQRDESYFKKVFPMSLRPQAHDIISFWLFTTVVKSYLHTGKLPWSTAMISGHALDPHGKPMHKSAGNLIDPQPLMEKYGADPLRHWSSISRLGEDASFQDKDVLTGAKLVNKLWNVAKFIELVSADKVEKKEVTNVIDKWILSRAMLVAKQATEMMEEYNSAGAKRIVDEFFWFFCDNYLEFIKYRTYANDASAIYPLRKTFLMVIKMLAPFVPFVTDEVYQNLYKKEERAESIHSTSWPEYEEKLFDKDALVAGDEAQKIIAVVRQWKHTNKIALNGEMSELIIEGDFDTGKDDVKGAMNIKKIVKGKGEVEVPDTKIRISMKA